MRWLSKRIGKKHDNITKAMKSQKDEGRGSRTEKELMTVQAIYNMWHDFSIVTVDKENGIEQMKMKEIELKKKFKDLIVPDNIELEFGTKERGQKIV